MKPFLLFPSSFFDSKAIDEDLVAEYSAAVRIRRFETGLFNYDDWFHRGRLSGLKASDKCRQTIYRGWMMTPQQYELFFTALQKLNYELITTPAEYSLMHAFPNVYKEIREDTAEIMVFPEGEEIDLDRIKEKFERFMVKDYVKSVKGANFPRFFDRSITQSELNDWLEVFTRYRGELFTGGICIKEFLDLKRYGHVTNEWRVFYIHHEAAVISRNSGQSEEAPPPPEEPVDRYRDLGSSFYTIDFAELADGTWTIIETGDGQVSGLPSSLDETTFYEILADRWA